jgi:hypothetical protein
MTKAMSVPAKNGKDALNTVKGLILATLAAI